MRFGTFYHYAALVVMALEVSLMLQQVGANEDVEMEPVDSSSSSPIMIKRVVRMLESSPESTPASPTGSNRFTNQGASNNIEVNPKISVVMPGESGLPQDLRSQNSRIKPVSYTSRRKSSRTIVPSPSTATYSVDGKVEDVTTTPIPSLITWTTSYFPSPSPSPSPSLDWQPSPANVEQLDSSEQHPEALEVANNAWNSPSSDSEVIDLVPDSGNRLSRSMDDSMNDKNIAVRNSGNSESITIDGVGNNKSIKLSNTGNTDVVEQDGTDNHHHDGKQRKKPKRRHHYRHGPPAVQIQIGPTHHPAPAINPFAPIVVPLVDSSALTALDDLSKSGVIPGVINPTSTGSGLAGHEHAHGHLMRNRPQQYVLVQQSPNGPYLSATPVVLNNNHQMYSPAPMVHPSMVAHGPLAPHMPVPMPMSMPMPMTYLPHQPQFMPPPPMTESAPYSLLQHPDLHRPPLGQLLKDPTPSPLVKDPTTAAATELADEQVHHEPAEKETIELTPEIFTTTSPVSEAPRVVELIEPTEVNTNEPLEPTEVNTNEPLEPTEANTNEPLEVHTIRPFKRQSSWVPQKAHADRPVKRQSSWIPRWPRRLLSSFQGSKAEAPATTQEAPRATI